MVKKSTQRLLVESILKTRGQSYAKWAKDISAEAAMKLMKDSDPALKELVLAQAEVSLIIEKMNSENIGGTEL